MTPDRLIDWLLAYEGILWPLGIVCLALLAMGVVLLPVIVLRLPGDYLVRDSRNVARRFVRMSVAGRILLVTKNLFGGLLVLAGILMLVTPGQGLVSIVLGLGLLDLPQKRHLLRLLISRQGVMKTINRFRRRFGRPPLQKPE